jgi:hypothetical protein
MCDAPAAFWRLTTRFGSWRRSICSAPRTAKAVRPASRGGAVGIRRAGAAQAVGSDPGRVALVVACPVAADAIRGFWELARRVKEVFPSSDQEWEESVVKPAFARPKGNTQPPTV